MNLLLDTHTFLWFVMDNDQLSSTAKFYIEDGDNAVYVSFASAWEVAIKVSTGKLTLPKPTAVFFEEQIRLNGFELLPLELEHLAPVETMPFHHRDPFDRLLLAQAITQSLTLISADTAFDRYDITRLW